MKKLWILIVKCCGWKFDIPAKGQRPELHHCVLAVAPHTCIADFFVGASVLWAMDLNPRIFMKKEFFNWFTRRPLTRLGVVAVDRGNRHNGLVQQSVDLLNRENDATIVITPESTRKAVKRWKRGFYDIAVQAQVPIVLGYMDFKTKHAGVGPSFSPSGDFAADLPRIMEFYKDITPKYPELYNTECRV